MSRLAPCPICGEVMTRGGAVCPGCVPPPPPPPAPLPTREALRRVVATLRQLGRDIGQLVRSIRADLYGMPRHVLPRLELVKGGAPARGAA